MNVNSFIGRSSPLSEHSPRSPAGFRPQPLALSLALMLACAASAQAQPVGGVVAAGSATIGGTAAQMTIVQTSPDAVINWQSFGIRAGESVQFIQPGSSSVALNRVLGGDPSSIMGSLSANGKVFLVNPNGVLFGNSASVNVGGLVASTLDISDAAFMARDYRFTGGGAGTVSNAGSLNASGGGFVALLGSTVRNEGVITATTGTVALAAGKTVTLQVSGDKLLSVAVDQGTMNALVDNGGLIYADGGQVVMTTQAADSLLSNAVNNTGTVQAQTLQNVAGTIKLLGGLQAGSVSVGGTLDASAPAGGDGGFVETSARQVSLAADAKITTLAPGGTTGLWLLNPFNYLIADTHGNETPAQVALSLADTNRTINATNDITVASALTWTTPQTLTLNAVHDVIIQAAVTASTAGSGVRLIAGNDVRIDAAVTASGAASVIDVTAGRDVVSTGALTASELDTQIRLTAGRDINVDVMTANAGGSITLIADNTVTLNGAITADGGAVNLVADADGSGPGVAGGTVVFTGNGAVSAVTTSLRFNPVSYANTPVEILAYDAKVTGALDARAWVFVQADNKVYDATQAATLSLKGSDVAGAVTLVGGAATFGDKNVGTAKTVSYAGYSLAGGSPDSFALFGTGAGTTQANITPLALVGSITAADKVYDGNAVATITSRNLAGVLGGDVVSYSGGAASFSDKNAGNGKLVTGSGLGLSGADAGNYTVTTATTTANITAAPLLITANGQTKTYGQSLVFNGSEFTAAGLQATDTVDSVTLVSPGAQATAFVTSTPYAIDPSAASGAGFVASNYAITYTGGALVVTPAALTVTPTNVGKPAGETALLTGFTTSPLANGETVGSVALASPGAAAAAGEGGYLITASDAAGGTFTPGNYSISYGTGQLVVLPGTTGAGGNPGVPGTPGNAGNSGNAGNAGNPGNAGNSGGVAGGLPRAPVIGRGGASGLLVSTLPGLRAGAAGVGDNAFTGRAAPLLALAPGDEVPVPLQIVITPAALPVAAVPVAAMPAAAPAPAATVAAPFRVRKQDRN